MRRRRPGRNVNGVLLLDKPAGITSNAALQKVKRLYQARKAGHTGSLDPLATGMLPICLGAATKISGFLLEADKSYHVLIRLGITTTTGDAEGTILENRTVPGFDRARLLEVLASFTGDIEQIPPMHSAIKQNGQPLYKLAHQGIVVAREPRRIHIHELQLLSHDNELLEVRVRCSKGTYIRTLAEDIGAALACGGHVSALRRLAVAGFVEQDMVSLASLEQSAASGVQALDGQLLSMGDALLHWPGLSLSSDVAYFFRQGQAVFVPDTPPSGYVRIYTGDEQFMGIGQVQDDGRIAPKRLMVR